MSGRKSYLLDLDGVLVRASRPVPGANEFIQGLRAAENKLYFVGKSTLSRSQLQAHTRCIFRVRLVSA